MSCEISRLTAGYRGKPVIEEVTLQVSPGTITGIIGPNGAGKSTLLNAVVGLLPSASGTVHFFGEPLARVRARVAYMPQALRTDPDFPVTVFDVVLMGTYAKLGWFTRPGKTERNTAHAALTRLGLDHLKKQQIGALSGGQRQRVFLARALAQNPDLFILDEPFQGIDAVSERRIINVLREERQRGASIVMVHHDLATVADYCDEVVLLNRRVQAAGPVADVFTPGELEKLYGIPAVVAGGAAGAAASGADGDDAGGGSPTSNQGVIA